MPNGATELTAVGFGELQAHWVRILHLYSIVHKCSQSSELEHPDVF